MSRLVPTAAEAGTLRFLISGIGWSTRWWLATGSFVLGLAVFTIGQPLGLVLALAGHLPLWVRGQTVSPGGSTPAHEDIWAPTESDWVTRVNELEEGAAKWDVSPWDISNLRGFLVLLAVIIVGSGMVFGLGIMFGFDVFVRLAVSGTVLFLPMWFNGMRTTWNPSELRLKGEALEIAEAAAVEYAGDEFERVPLLALREGPRGKYPVDARLMLRPSDEDESGFIGIQVQVSLNNVRGTDYPYLYCVVLGKEGFELPGSRGEHQPDGVGFRVVFERGAGSGAEFFVVRRHADQAGGWHTQAEHIEALVRLAIDHARTARKQNRA